MNNDGTKKQRGSNYTPAEQMLLDLIKKNIEIIENKETNAVVNSKKRTAWHEIAQHYNAMAVTGSKNWIQLRYLYENIKERRRREINGKEISCADDVDNASALTETDKWIQTIVSRKIEPRQFGIDLTITGDDMETITVPAQAPFIVKHEIGEDRISAAGSCKDVPDGDGMDSITVPAQPSFIKKHEIEEDRMSAAGSTKELSDDITKKKQPDNETCCRSAKEVYYKLKLSNAKLERKFLLQRHKMEKEKLALELEILNLKRQKLL